MIRKVKQKVMATMLCASMVILACGAPKAIWGADPEVFTVETLNNHWVKSEVRAWLNGLDKSSGTLPIDGSGGGETYTNGLGESSDSFLKCFTDEELELFEAKEVTTNKFPQLTQESCTTYTTTDRFWLPSGNYNNDQVISAAPGYDLSSNSAYAANVNVTSANSWKNLVSAPAWASGTAWLRSPYCNDGFHALYSYRGSYVNYNNVGFSRAACACAYLPLNSVLFTSAVAASAATAAENFEAGKILQLDVPACDKLGQKVEDAVPSWGMYLKLKDDRDDALSLQGDENTPIEISSDFTTVTFKSNEAMKQGAYLCLQAFKGWSDTTGNNVDNAKKGDNVYYGVQQIADSTTTEVTFNLNNYASELTNSALMVWLEEPIRGTLSFASSPISYRIDKTGTVTKLTGSINNPRVFAMAEDLQPSLGTFSSAAQLTSGDIRVGNGATWQKLYIGEVTDGKPIEWWIAGRDDGNNAGLTLYQASANTVTHAFNGWSPELSFADGVELSEEALDKFSKDDFALSYYGTPLSDYASAESFFVEYSLDGKIWLKKSELTQNGNYYVRAKFAGESMDLKTLVRAQEPYYVLVYPSASAPADGTVHIEMAQPEPEPESEPESTTPSENGGSDETDKPDAITGAGEAESELLTLNATVNAAGQSINCILQDPNGALPEGTQLGVVYIEPGTPRWYELREQLDPTYEVENVAFFEITLYDKDGNKLPMPLSNKVRVLLQIPSGWDKADLEAALVRSGVDAEFEEELETIDGVEYLSFWTDHFSPYAMIDKLTPAEKAALKTGEAIGFYAVLDAILLAAAGALVLVLTRKRKSI